LKSRFIYYRSIVKNSFEDISIWLIDNNINDINKGDTLENSPIMLAYLNNQTNTFNKLLEKKALLDSFNFSGKNLISIVAEKGDYKTFLNLVNNFNVNIHFTTTEGIYEDYSILEFAIEGGSLDIVKFLQQRKINFKTNKLNLMIIAAEKGNIEMMTFLESIGIKMNSKKKDGWTTLMSAAKSGKLDAVMLILGYGADVNDKTNFNWTALMSAVVSKNLEIVKTLVESGADILFENNDKMNSVEISIENENDEITNYLRDKISEKTK
jgi:ankyrin repeat protein